MGEEASIAQGSEGAMPIGVMALEFAAAPEVVQVRDENEDPRFSSYLLGHARSAASRLRALANAIEAPLFPSS